jgi:hypothetical protein
MKKALKLSPYAYVVWDPPHPSHDNIGQTSDLQTNVADLLQAHNGSFTPDL